MLVKGAPGRRWLGTMLCTFRNKELLSFGYSLLPIFFTSFFETWYQLWITSTIVWMLAMTVWFSMWYLSNLLYNDCRIHFGHVSLTFCFYICQNFDLQLDFDNIGGSKKISRNNLNLVIYMHDMVILYICICICIIPHPQELVRFPSWSMWGIPPLSSEGKI